ncbi:MAG: ATP-binding protein [Bacteroidales bacterium]|nr:ATP-binding protein [Bacteroidales bacterium]
MSFSSSEDGGHSEIDYKYLHLQKGEGIEIEFKTSRFELNKDVFESVCAFLNRKGGHLLLGVNNDGIVEGVMDNCIQDIINSVVTNANNPQKLNPPVYLSAQVLEYEGKKVKKTNHLF